MKKFQISSYSYDRYPNLATLARALASSKPDSGRQERQLHRDNEWAASSFLALLLLSSRRCRPRLDRQRATELLVQAGTPGMIEDLEAHDAGCYG